MKKMLLIALFLLLAALPALAHMHNDAGHETKAGIQALAGSAVISTDTPAYIFYNEACDMCSAYIKTELLPLLAESGISNIEMKDYINERKNRDELNEMNEMYGIPANLKGHIMVFIRGRVILAGHVPGNIVRKLLSGDAIGADDKILVYQDKMENAKTYIAWGFKGEPKDYPIDADIGEYLAWFNANKNTLAEPSFPRYGAWTALLPLVVSAGFLDGINPCAFAVLLFFIAFLFTIHKTRAGVWKMGLAYISAIFLAYFLIGIGLMKALMFTGNPHFMAKLGAWLIIGLGIVNIANFLLPEKRKLNLGIPHFAKEPVKKWMYKATLPAAFILGFLVGLCTFPCSGGIYVAVVGLLAAKATYMHGLAYLVVYNLMFVLPLFIILIAASTRTAAERLASWERSQSKIVKLMSGLVMIALGIVILLWFVH